VDAKRLTPKERLQLPRQSMPAQDAALRRINFTEVNLGLPEKFALIEADRCLQCKNPRCMEGCPVGVNIPRFLDLLSQGNLPEAARSLLGDNALPAITGRVCPRSNAVCVRARGRANRSPSATWSVSPTGPGCPRPCRCQSRRRAPGRHC
jgi:glutamate synthase (NADPH/NADH) small chain